jgi:hypothetical protein
MDRDWCDDERDVTHMSIPDSRSGRGVGVGGGRSEGGTGSGLVPEPAPYVDMGAVCRDILRELSPRRCAAPVWQHSVRHIDHEFEPRGESYWHHGVPEAFAQAVMDEQLAAGTPPPAKGTGGEGADLLNTPAREGAMEKRRHLQAVAAAHEDGGMLLDVNVPNKLRRHAYY